MAPTPWTPTHRLDIEYAVSLESHVAQLGCYAVLGGGGSYDLIRHTISNRAAADCAADFTLVFKALLATSSNITGYTLYEHLGANIFAPVEQNSIGVAGTRALPPQPAWQITNTYRDIDHKIAKQVELETVYGGLLHLAYPTGDAQLDAFIASTLPASAGTNSIWEFWNSRGGVRIKNVRFVTVAPNKRIRRKRNLI